MQKGTFLLLVGVLLYVLPLLGVPELWKDTAQFVLGGCIILAGIACRLETRRRKRTGAAETLHVEYDPAAQPDVRPL